MISECGPWAPANWANSQFANLIDFPVYASASGIKKPNVDLYRKAAQGLHTSPENCMCVADGNREELAVADKLGMRAVRITPWNEFGSTPDADYSNPWNGKSVDDLSELIVMLG